MGKWAQSRRRGTAQAAVAPFLYDPPLPLVPAYLEFSTDWFFVVSDDPALDDVTEVGYRYSFDGGASWNTNFTNFTGSVESDPDGPPSTITLQQRWNDSAHNALSDWSIATISSFP